MRCKDRFILLRIDREELRFETFLPFTAKLTVTFPGGERQFPEDLPLTLHDEAHFPADRSSITYRQGLFALGLGRRYTAWDSAVISFAELRMAATEEQRAAELLKAQTQAEALFHEVEARGLIRPGITENGLNADIYALAQQLYGITTYWHKRIVRAGKNTLLPYAENPPDLTIGEDDILFLDLGPVFEPWEADFGRTFVLGSDPLKLKMRHDVKSAFADGKRHFKDHPDITSRELFHYVESLAAKYSWEFGGPIAGHLIGQFPHERIADDKVALYVHPNSHLTMRSLDANGQKRHWILEIHFVDRDHEIGGFYEELLTL